MKSSFVDKKPIAKYDWIALIVAIIVVLALLLVIVVPRSTAGGVQVIVEGKVIKEFDQATLTQGVITMYKIKGVTLMIGDGKVCVQQAVQPSVGKAPVLQHKGDCYVINSLDMTIRVV